MSIPKHQLINGDEVSAVFEMLLAEIEATINALNARGAEVFGNDTTRIRPGCSQAAGEGDSSERIPKRGLQTFRHTALGKNLAQKRRWLLAQKAKS